MAKYETMFYTDAGFATVDANGYLAKFDDWFIRSSGAGGAGWYVMENGSTPIIKTYNPNTDIDAVNDTIAISGHGFFTGQKITTIATNIVDSGGVLRDYLYFVRSVDANTIKLYLTIYNALNDISAINLSVGTTTPIGIASCPYKVYSNAAIPVLNDNTTKIVEVWHSYYQTAWNSPQIYRTARFNIHMWWDVVNHLPYGTWSGAAINVGSGSGYPAHFVGDSDFFMASTENTPNVFIFDDWTYNTSGFEDATKIGTLSLSASAGRRVTLTLGSSEAANFTSGKFYFIYDFDGHSQVEYVKVLSVNTGTDTIVVDPLTYNYPAGAKIGSYPHRFYTGSKREGGYGGPYVFYQNFSEFLHIPYYSVYTRTSSSSPCDRTFYDQVSGLIHGYLRNPNIYLTAKDEEGTYYVQKVLMSENVDYTNFAMIQAKVVGTPNHLYFHNNNITITRFVDKIDINGTDYLCMGQVSIYSLQNPSDSSLGLLFQCENS